MRIKKAFTLAEVLLAMSVIAVVTVLTVPALKHHTDEKQYIAGAAKAFNVLQTATSVIESEHGNTEFWNWATDNVVGWYSDIMNFSAAPSRYTTYNVNASSRGSFGGNDCYMTADGMIWRFSGNVVLVDVNGKELPNAYGIDIHRFVIGNERVAPGNNCTNAAVYEGVMPQLEDGNIVCADI